MKLEDAFEQFHQLHEHRKKALFTEFLPEGYSLTTLDCVPTHARDEIIFIKCLLGMHITLYDDLADNHDLANVAILAELYKIPFDLHLLSSSDVSTHEQRLMNFARTLTDDMMATITKLPRYDVLKEIFEFDFKQFYNANHYYSLALKNIHLLNSWEIKSFGPFNMGMVIAGTIDLIASSTFMMNDLRHTRSLLIRAQRFGHIANTITTLAREIKERTFTNEAIILCLEQGKLSDDDLENAHDQSLLDETSSALTMLKIEQQKILSEISQRANAIKSWNAIRYVNNLSRLQTLHEQFLGVI